MAAASRCCRQPGWTLGAHIRPAAASLQPVCDHPSSHRRRDPGPPTITHTLPTPTAAFTANDQHGPQRPQPIPRHRRPASNAQRLPGRPSRPHGGGQRPLDAYHGAIRHHELLCAAHQRAADKWPAGNHQQWPADAENGRIGEIRIHGPLASQR